MDVKLSVTGIKQIDNVLKGLPLVFQHSVVQAAHVEAAIPMVNRIHRLSPVGKTGKLADSAGTVKTPFRKAGAIGEIQVGPRRGVFGGQTAHLHEFGTRERKTKKKHPYFGFIRGKMEPKPYVEPAYEQTKNIVIDRIGLALGKKTYAFMRRKIKNG